MNRHSLFSPLSFLGAAILAVIPTVVIPQLRYNVAWAPWPFLIGTLFVLTGFSLMIWGLRTFQDHGTANNHEDWPSHLVQSGPYQFSRHPMYLGMLFILLGIAMILAHPLAILGPLFFFILMDRRHMPFEEEVMRQSFGDSYTAYQKRVRRWLGRPTQ